MSPHPSRPPRSARGPATCSRRCALLAVIPQSLPKLPPPNLSSTPSTLIEGVVGVGDRAQPCRWRGRQAGGTRRPVGRPPIGRGVVTLVTSVVFVGVPTSNCPGLPRFVRAELLQRRPVAARRAVGRVGAGFRRRSMWQAGQHQQLDAACLISIVASIVRRRVGDLTCSPRGGRWRRRQVAGGVLRSALLAVISYLEGGPDERA
jgi:hypothetical protein